MWSVSNQSIQFATGSVIKPEKVLYQFDGPLIFTAQMENTSMLFFKFDTVSDNDLLIATPVDDRMITALESRVIAVREALGIGNCIIVELDISGRIHNYWQTCIDQLDQKLLPDFGVMLGSTK